MTRLAVPAAVLAAVFAALAAWAAAEGSSAAKQRVVISERGIEAAGYAHGTFVL